MAVQEVRIAAYHDNRPPIEAVSDGAVMPKNVVMVVGTIELKEALAAGTTIVVYRTLTTRAIGCVPKQVFFSTTDIGEGTVPTFTQVGYGKGEQDVLPTPV